MTDYDDKVAAMRDLALAYQARGTDRPTHEADQMEAASRDSLAIHDQYRQLLKAAGREPTEWRSNTDPDRIERLARILATTHGLTQCAHIRRQPQQPIIARLALHRVDCGRCFATHRRPPIGEDDRCDFCGSRGNTMFTGITNTLANLTVIGDACDDCAPHFIPDTEESDAET
jgi:hypothetical protein